MKIIIGMLAILCLSARSRAQVNEPQGPEPVATPSAPETTATTPQEIPGQTFQGVSSNMQRQLEDSLTELAALREAIAAERTPMDRELSALEDELSSLRKKAKETNRRLDTSSRELVNLRETLQQRETQITYISNTLMGEYIREWQTRLHIAEAQHHASALKEAATAITDRDAKDLDALRAKLRILELSLERLESASGATVIEGTAVDSETGVAYEGKFVLLGPAALFVSRDGTVAGTADLKRDSLQPNVYRFRRAADPAAETPTGWRAKLAEVEAWLGIAKTDDDRSAQYEEQAIRLGTVGTGEFPLDPTLGNARLTAETEESLLEHIQKGGPIMKPIMGMALCALAVALWKFLTLLFVRRPSRSRMAAFLAAVGRGELGEAKSASLRLAGPTGAMLRNGTEVIGHPKELIEEIMFESVLRTRTKLESWLPFIAIAAASAPLLGLLGTVTGIINTFKMITLYGSGDVKSLSGGISEALITTEYGLIVAIPSLLLHAFLSRKARSAIHQMESAAMSFLNELSKAQSSGKIDPDRTLEIGSGRTALLDERARAKEPRGESRVRSEAPADQRGGASSRSRGLELPGEANA